MTYVAKNTLDKTGENNMTEGKNANDAYPRTCDEMLVHREKWNLCVKLD